MTMLPLFTLLTAQQENGLRILTTFQAIHTLVQDFESRSPLSRPGPEVAMFSQNMLTIPLRFCSWVCCALDDFRSVTNHDQRSGSKLLVTKESEQQKFQLGVEHICPTSSTPLTLTT